MRARQSEFELPWFARFALIFTAVFLAHSSLLRLPYFWDEAGYYIPAARDLLNGSLIPHSTTSNAHPPLVMAWLALWWKLSGYTPAVTRTAMLLVSAFGLAGVFRLARNVANTPVAVASTLLTALYPVWFAQSSLAHLDMAAAAFTLWGVDAYVRRKVWPAVVWFGLAGVAKETAIVAPLALIVWELVKRVGPPFLRAEIGADFTDDARETKSYTSGAKAPDSAAVDGTAEAVPLRGVVHGNSSSKQDVRERGLNRETGSSKQFVEKKICWQFLLSLVPLAAWFAFHYLRTGRIFGNPEFFRYNVAATVTPLRIVLAIGERLWHALGYMNMFALTGAAALAMMSPALPGRERDQIAVPTQLAFGALLIAYILMLSVLGGAVLARYMLPVVPLVIIISVSTLRRRVPWWRWLIVVAAVGFVSALITNPFYRSAPEDNLNYADFVRLHKRAAEVIQESYSHAHVLTAWPASDELTHPYLGYVKQPVSVVRIDNFTVEQMTLAAQAKEQYDVALLFSTKLEPEYPLLDSFAWWRRIHERFFDYHRDLPPDVAAQMLGGTVKFTSRSNGQWVAIVEFPRVFNARVEHARE